MTRGIKEFENMTIAIILLQFDGRIFFLLSIHTRHLLYLLTKDDIIDYAIDNCNNLEIMSFILKYREDNNNIMHILFANKKNKEILSRN